MKINAITTHALLAALLLTTAPVAAQQNLWTGGVGGNWLDGTWNQFGAPDPDLDAEAVVGTSVGSGSPTGEVSVTSDIRFSNPSASVVLGQNSGNSGTLNITSTGKMAVTSGAFSAGNFVVGEFGGLGVLNVASGGVLEIENGLVNASGAEESTISLVGTASVSAASGFLDRRLSIDGSDVSLSFQGNVTFGLAGTHNWVIPATGASTVLVGGDADLGGTLKVDFPDGTPAVGTTWNLIDATTIDDAELNPSGFSFVDTSTVTGLKLGERFATRTVASGSSVNGTFGQLVLEQHPVLLVDRDSGMVSIHNPGGVESIAIDSYAITSPNVGALVPGAWQSLDPSGGWLESNPSANTLSELNPDGTGTFAANSTTDLGAIYNRPAPTAFGEENEDLRFRYSKPDGLFIEGDIVYTGLPNNTLTLNVDPDTGEAQIVNATGFTVSIDTYVISSASESLKAADGLPADTWSSLEDQGASGGAWYEANSDAGQISELLVDGGLVLAPDATVNLGSPFDDVDGMQDLVFRFALVGGSSDGDFNNDGVVDAADYAVYRNALGEGDDSSLNNNGDGVAGVTTADYDVWRANYGNTNSGAGEPTLLTGKVHYSPLVSLGVIGGATAAAPEPTSLSASAALAVLWVLRRRRSS